MGRDPAISGQRSAASGQRSAISGQRSAASDQRSAISDQHQKARDSRAFWWLGRLDLTYANNVARALAASNAYKPPAFLANVASWRVPALLRWFSKSAISRSISQSLEPAYISICVPCWLSAFDIVTIAYIHTCCQHLFVAVLKHSNMLFAIAGKPLRSAVRAWPFT